MYIYSNLKHIRERLKMSKNQFADKLGLNVSNISRWENSKNGMSLDTAELISQKLNIPIDILIGKDLTIQENVELDETHKLESIILDKTKTLSEDDKKKIIDIIDIYTK